MNNARLTRRHRLLESNDFKCVFSKQPCRLVDASFTLLCIHNRLDFARLGLAIARKTIKRALGRNRIKRIVRESFRHHKVQLKGFDIVVMSRNGSEKKSNKELFDSLDNHWRKVADQCESHYSN
ncbi:MAG: ribonuclease P protein component [Gammaproteobacteria bacterium]|nr:MAG: ribonuclease P protein component [Gammaproteobacteria bacterium]